MGNVTEQKASEIGVTRWATFDCYGTLVDWNRGLGDELERLFGAESREPALARYHRLEREIQARDPAAPYRLLTPPTSLRALTGGYPVEIHPEALSPPRPA